MISQDVYISVRKSMMLTMMIYIFDDNFSSFFLLLTFVMSVNLKSFFMSINFIFHIYLHALLFRIEHRASSPKHAFYFTSSKNNTVQYSTERLNEK